MKILYLTGQLALHGGIERVTTMKLNYLAEHTDHEVYLCTSEQGSRPFIYPISTKVHYHQLKVKAKTPVRPVCFGMITKLHSYYNNILLWKKEIKRIAPDIIIVPNMMYSYWALPFICGKAKIVREFHDSQFYRRYTYSFKLILDRLVQRLYDRVVVLTPEEIDYFSYKKNVSVIPNPIDISYTVSDQTKNQVVTIGRISRVKGFENLIFIAEIVHSKIPDICFDIYGGGDNKYQSELQGLIDERNLHDTVRFRGVTNNVQETLSHSKIYLCTSKTESFGLTLLEAQSCGVPIVSFDCPNGPRNVIDNGISGILIKQDDVESAAEEIIRLIKDRERLSVMGFASRKKAEGFYIENIMKLWMNLFNTL